MNGKRLLLLAVAMAVLVALCVYTIDSMIRVGDEGEMRTVEDAVRHAALTCFAVEGAYPSELSYLQEHYGLHYDESRYHVLYEAFASNQMPQIRVTLRGDGLV
ncbi:MAG: hypothetical protein IJB69_08285 [Clostridia bacterium]|nr:hypothetical protein [Clostridia bacterium]